LMVLPQGGVHLFQGGVLHYSPPTGWLDKPLQSGLLNVCLVLCYLPFLLKNVEINFLWLSSGYIISQCCQLFNLIVLFPFFIVLCFCNLFVVLLPTLVNKDVYKSEQGHATTTNFSQLATLQFRFSSVQFDRSVRDLTQTVLYHRNFL